mmetsp:Transcript_140871/g.392671  ORF Transcript_140871/g.392671 Transcript_140871/m.392671 type:complete len:321 (+) Transcript_140871:86-1048(+)
MDDAEEGGREAEEEEDTEARLSGSELFRELKRLLPTAIFGDYYQNGAWKRRHLLVDIELVQAHRREAGAPDPPSLSERDIPELAQMEPSLPPSRASGSAARNGRRRAPGEASSRLTPTQPPEPPPRALVADARHEESARIREFTEKWRVNPKKGKLLLARLRPSQQLWVMRHFRVDSTSMGPTTQLEHFIRDAERNGDLAAAEGPGTAGRGSTARRVPPAASPPSRSAAAPSSRGTSPRSPLPRRAPARPFAGNSGSGEEPAKRARTGDAPRPSAAPGPTPRSSAATRLSSPAAERQPEPKKGPPKVESRPGDLIKNLLC